MTGALATGRASFAARAWGDAVAQLSAADDEEPLDLDDLEKLALAAYLAGHDDRATAAWTRGHRESLRLGDRRRAARCAILLASGLDFRGEIAPAKGWYARAARALEGVGECRELGLLRAMDTMELVFTAQHATADPVLAETELLGRRLGDPDVLAIARTGLGMSGVMQGRCEEGMALLDEVMAAVTAGEVSPLFCGIAYCATIHTCTEVFDLRRAREWTAALTRWCDSQPDLVPYRGTCLVHRSQLLQLQGAWPQALEAAQAACEVLAGPVHWDSLGSAYYQLGEVQRLRGDDVEAERSYARAREQGRDPQPGLALLSLQRGRGDVAAAAIQRALAESGDPTSRARLLPAAVEILVSTGDLDEARAAVVELTGIAATLDAPYLRAVAAHAEGQVLVAGGEPAAALARLRAAASAWRELDAPHENARVRVLLAQACLDLGDEETARLEREAALSAFRQLGAHPDVARLGPPASAPRPGGLTAREVQVLQHVAAGMSNRTIAQQLVLSERTVARHVSNIFVKIGVPSRSAATAYAYEHDLVPAAQK